LFVGPVEQPLALDHGFVSANLPMAFASRKAGHGARRQRLGRLSNRSVTPPGLQPWLPSGGKPTRSLAGKPSLLPRADLATARRLADAGRLKEAAEICEAYLRESRFSAQAYYLLGLVRDARGDASAIDCYRKALYLDPSHYESLLQMALLLQKNGDPAGARTFKNRAQRVRARM
jgi:chemotaxis protein methyltransferase WspC